MVLIDQMAYASKLRDVNPDLKVFFSVAVLLITIGIQSMEIGIFVAALMGILSIKAGGVPVKYYFRLLCLPLIFIVTGLLTIIINLSPEPLSNWYFKMGSWYLTTNETAICQGILLGITCIGAVSCMYFMALTTPMPDFIGVLLKLHCPYIIIELMMLIYRFIFSLFEIAGTLGRAQKSRLGNCNFKVAILSAGRLFSVLFLHAFRKSSALYDAMESRCYNGTIPMLSEGRSASRKEIFVVSTTIVIIFIAALWLRK